MKNLSDKFPFLPASYTLIAKNVGLLFGLQGVQRFLGLITTYVIVRAVSPEAFGEYHFVLSVVAVLSIFGLPGVNNAVMQAVARNHRGTYRVSVKPGILGSLLGGLILAGAGVWYLGAGKDTLGICFLAAGALFPLAYGLTQWKGVRIGAEDFVAILALDGLTSVIVCAMVIGAVFLVTGSIIALVAIMLLVPGTMNLVMTRVTFKQIDHDEPVESGSTRYGLKLTVYMVFGVIAKHIDKLVIFVFMTPASLAIFVAAERIPELIKTLIKNVASVLAPRFARHRGYAKRVDRAVKLFSFIAGGLVVAFAFLALPWLVMLVFGEEYRESIPYAQALMCSVAIVSVAPFQMRFILSRRDTTSFRDINSVMAIVRILASVLLVPIFGLLGAVISAFVFRIGTVLVVEIIMRKRYPTLEDSGVDA